MVGQGNRFHVLSEPPYCDGGVNGITLQVLPELPYCGGRSTVLNFKFLSELPYCGGRSTVKHILSTTGAREKKDGEIYLTRSNPVHYLRDVKDYPFSIIGMVNELVIFSTLIELIGLEF